MKRTAKKDLVAWKGRADRRPLIVRGARQVGKTYAYGEDELRAANTGRAWEAES